MLKFIKSFFAKPTPPVVVAESEIKVAPVMQAPLPEKKVAVPEVPRTPITNNIDEVGKMLADKAKTPKVEKETPALKEAWPYPVAIQPAEPAVVAPIKKPRKPRAKKAT